MSMTQARTSRLHPLPHIWFDWGGIKWSHTTPLDPNQEPKRYTCAREVDKLPGPDAANWTPGHGYRSWFLFLLSIIMRSEPSSSNSVIHSYTISIYLLSTFQYVSAYVLSCRELASNGCNSSYLWAFHISFKEGIQSLPLIIWIFQTSSDTLSKSKDPDLYLCSLGN